MLNLKPFADAILAICHQLIANTRSDSQSKEEILQSALSREPLPKAQLLEGVLKSCYEASLQTDEGRPCHFKVVFTSDGEPSFPRSAKVACSQDLSLNSRSLAMMSTVHDSRSGALLWAMSSEGQPVIRGIVSYPPSSNNGTQYSPGGLQIRCKGPGRLDVSYYMHSVAAIDGIHESFAVLGQTIDASEYVGTAAWNLNAIVGIDLIASMIERIRRHGHGGSIWIGDVGGADDVRIKFPVDQQQNHRYAEGKVTPWQYLDQYAYLANTDGAVLFNWQGLLQGFGVFGGVDKGVDVRVLGPRGDLGTKSIESLGGARKQSAATFVSRHDGAAALVVSQDGQATIIHRDDKSVVAAIIGVPVLSM